MFLLYQEMIQLHLERRQIRLSPHQQALAKAAASRQAMRLQFLTQLTQSLPRYTTHPPLSLHPDTIKYMVTKYSEQVVFYPLEEVDQWFNYSQGHYLEPGYPPLYYSRGEYRLISPNKSAIAAIGEAVAGLLAQRLYQCRKLARPTHDYTDIVMVGNQKTYLVEAKATMSGDSEIQQVLEEELLRLSAYVSACAELDSRPVVGILAGTALLNEHKYRCYINEVSL